MEYSAGPHTVSLSSQMTVFALIILANYLTRLVIDSRPLQTTVQGFHAF